MGWERFEEAVTRGKNGENEGLPIGMEAMSKFLPNLQKKQYYIIGGNTGSGKTTFMLDKFMSTPMEYVLDLQRSENNPKNIDVEGLFYTFEVDEDNLIAKALSRKIYQDTKKTLPVNYILSRGKNRISAEDYNLVLSYVDYWDFYEEKIRWTEVPKSVEELQIDMHNLAKANGTIYKDELGNFSYYVPHNPNKYLIVWIDHLALAELSKGRDLQATMSDISKMLVRMRNAYKLTIIVIQQLNMELFDTARVKIGRLAPTLADFGDNKRISRDADVVLALHNPLMFSQPAYSGYNINILKDRFRSVEILKNRYGEANKKVGCFFNGAVGIISELPPYNSDNMKKVYDALQKPATT